MASRKSIFKNLSAEMARHDVTQGDIADELQVSRWLIGQKFLGNIRITRDEMYHIRDLFFSDKTVDYLFECDRMVTRNVKSKNNDVVRSRVKTKEVIAY